MTDDLRGLDRMVAEKIMGISGPFDLYYEFSEGFPFLSHYTTHLASAWEIVEKLRPKWRLHLTDAGDRGWRAEFLLDDVEEVDFIFRIAETPALAIVLAALEAVAS